MSGLPWAPFTRPRSQTAQQSSGTRGDAAEVRKQRREGLLELLAGRPRDAVAALEKASAAPDASVWSDLAAAYHEVAVRYEAPAFLADALAATDRALSLQPDHLEALFNRALVLEHLGLRIDARTAWSRYLTTDAGSGWADEARKHFDALEPERPFLEALDAEYDRIGTEPAAAQALYERDRFAARGQAITEILGRWAHAMGRGDGRAAARHLNVARELGRAVAHGGDRTVERAVAAIDHAGDPAALAAAHADLYAGFALFRSARPEEAEPFLRRAAAAFRQVDSPAAIPAALWAANCLYERGRREDARKELEALLEKTSGAFPAYRGFVMWQLANCHKMRGEWGAAIALYEQSAALFERLGETGNVANVRGILAGVYEKIGDAETAWKNRLASLSGGIRENEIDERTVWFIVEAAIVRRDWQVASSFLTVYVEVNRRLHNDVELATALLLRSIVRDRLDDPAGAAENLAEARRVASSVDDSSYQERLRAAEWRTVAMLRSTPAATADALLTRAIDYESTTGQPSAVPSLLLLRARARRRANDVAGAIGDVREGIRRLEQYRESLPEGAARWGAFHSAEELFEEGVDLALVANDCDTAFRITERARARTLLEAYGASPEFELHSLPPRTVVVEYASLPAGLVFFVADASGLRCARTNDARDALVAERDALIAALRENALPQARRAAASLYRHLVEPIASHLTGAETVVFVPDGATYNVPFSALVDARGDYLLRRHAIIVAPSAAAFAVANERRRRKAAPRAALIVTASTSTAGTGALPYVDIEANRIVRQYRSAFRIDERSSQLDELMARAPAADVIHFGGHAVGDSRGYEPASIVLRSHGGERRVGVAEIAKLRLDRASVVVLAGCGTARGKNRAAEGLVSVAHGFLSAGVPSTIATLWSIDDDVAAVFFPRLHEKLATGMAPAEALRAVQLDAIQRGDIPPSLWAAVQLIGS